MKLVVLAILVFIVLSTSSFEVGDHAMGSSMEIPDSSPRGVFKKNGTVEGKSNRTVRLNSACKWSKFNLQPFGETTNTSLRRFLLIKLGGIASTDCILFYHVESNDGGSPYYPFRIERQTNFYSKTTVYGIVSVDDEGNFMWTSSYRGKFEHYLAWCDSKAGTEDQRPQVPHDLSCGQTHITPTTPFPQVIPNTAVEQVIPPLEDTTTSTTRVIPTATANTPPLEETTTPFLRVTPPQEVVSTTLSTRAIPTREITPTTFSPSLPGALPLKSPLRKFGRGCGKR